MKEGYWMIRTVTSGKVIEKSQFYVGKRKPRAPRRKGSTSAARRDKNMNLAARQLARTINCNWGRGDLFLSLTYDDAHLAAMGDTAEGADRCCELFWRRLRRTLKAAGVTLRGFWLTADKDEETGEPVRLHHHAVIACEGVTVRWNEDGSFGGACIGGRDLRELWGQGGVNVEVLRAQDDFTPLAVYCVRQAVGGENAKKWHPSRGLKKPMEENHIAVTARELRAPGGAVVSEIGRYDAETGSHYIRYIRRPRGKTKQDAPPAIPEKGGGV